MLAMSTILHHNAECERMFSIIHIYIYIKELSLSLTSDLMLDA